jgi:hypothetical protein
VDNSQAGTLAWKKDLLKTPELVRLWLALNEDELEQYGVPYIPA